MRKLRSLFMRLAGLFCRGRSEQELTDEIESHLQFHIDDGVRFGMSLDEARRTARIKLGSIDATKEELRDRRGIPLMETSVQDLRLAIRRILKRPAVSIAAMLTLAFSIGASAATWSLLSAVLLRPLALEEPSRLMVVGELRTRQGTPGVVYNAFTYPFYSDVRNSGVFERVVAQWLSPHSMLVGAGGLTERTAVGFVTYEFFDVLGVQIPFGRGFLPDEDQRGASPVAVLTDQYWRRIFNADSGVIGRRIQVAGKTVTIVGVAMRGFRGLDLSQSSDLYLPFNTIADVGSPMVNYFAEAGHQSSPTAGTMIIGRLREGERGTEVATRLTNLRAPSPELTIVGTDLNTAAIPAAAQAGMSQFARLLGTTVGLLLLIGCLTVGMLLLTRTEARRDELAMCLALGASRTRLARGIAFEGGVLATTGAVMAIPVAWCVFWGIRSFQLPGNISVESLNLTLDDRTLLATMAAGMFATVAIALVAGMFGFSTSAREALQQRSAATPRLTQRRTRAALVVGQVAVALVLLAGAGLFTRSLMEALSLNSDLDMDRIVIGTVSLGQYGYDVSPATVFFDNLMAQLSANPAIRSIAFNSPQGGMGTGGRIVIDGLPHQFPSMVSYTAVDPRYFRTMGMRLLKGRDFSNDDRSAAPLVTVVSESFGRLLANGGDVVGHRITASSSRAGQPPGVMEVVGVVADVVANVSVLEPLVMYFPISQTMPGTSRSLVVHAAADADVARREIVNTIRQLDSAITPEPFLTMEQRISGQMSSQQFGAFVMGTLGVIAVLLTLLGTYVLAESMAVLRMREMGIRSALGATSSQLGAIVFAETVRLVGLGLLAGLALAWAGASTIRAFLFRVQPLDLATLAAMAALILVLAIVVSLRPVLRAARVDIGRVLREE